MRSPARAIAWEFRRRYRWGFLASAAYLIVLATIKLVGVAGRPIHLNTPESFAFVVMVPLSSMLTYFLAVFSFGLSGDLALRQSMYPGRFFTLPVTTASLAGWPMLFGAVTLAAFWFVMRGVALWPSDVRVPIIWPALLAVSLLAWTQALVWMPYPLPGLRVIVTVLWLTTIDTLALLALHYKAREPFMVALLAPQIPLGYVAARLAVARARRGDTPDWRPAFARVARTLSVRSMARGRFSSAARAQAWFEWRRHGRSLPALMAILLPFELALLFVASDVAWLIVEILLGVLSTPVLMGALVAATVRKSSAHDPFVTTKPLTDAELVAAKLRATVWSTLAAWTLVLVAIPIALEWSGTWPVLLNQAHRLADGIGTLRTVVVVLVVVAGFIVATWKQLVQSLYIGLTGREWLVKGSVFLTLTFVFLLGPLIQWVVDTKRVQVALWNDLPVILAILVCVKMSAAAPVAARLFRSRVVSDRILVSGAACWSAAVLALYALQVWFFATPLIPHSVFVLIAILATPLVRVSAAPLALNWNRHR